MGYQANCLATLWFCLSAIAGTVVSQTSLSATSKTSMAPRSLRSDIPGLPSELLPALDFEKTTWANGSVYEDDFYKLPENSSNAPAGTLFKSEDADPRVYELPPATSLARISYQSVNLEGDLVPASGYVLFPYSPRKNEDGSLQVVVWCHGTSGLFPEAGPSHIKNLWQHYLAPFPLALQGYAVVATDYAGLGLPRDGDGYEIVHEYLAAPAAANDALYALEAARQAFPELGERFVTVGHSQGGGAVWKIAEKLKESPVNGYLGGAAISPITRTLALPSENNPPYELIGAARLEGIQKHFPDFDPNSILTTEGQQRLAVCIATHAAATTMMACLSGAALFSPGWDKNEYVTQYDDLVSPGEKPIQGPLLVINGVSDPIANVDTTTTAVEKTVELNPSESITYATLANVTHVPAMFASQALWLDWVKARFNGESAEEGYNRSDLVGHRPVQSYSPELTWYIEFATTFWQAPI